MTIYWVRTDNDNAILAMEAVERALVIGDQGLAPGALAGMQEAESETTDPYLEENLAVLHTAWPVDQQRIIRSRRAGLGPVINGFQHVLRRATWWYNLPQWHQISEFHAALVRAIDSLLAHQGELRQLVMQGQAAPAERTQLLEQQIHMLRMEQVTLLNRVADLEQQLATLRGNRE